MELQTSQPQRIHAVPKTLPRDYRLWLKTEFEQRRSRNPAYSLRAFARDLQLAPTRISDILLKKQGLSGPAATKVAKALSLTLSQTEYFLALVETEHARSRIAKESAAIRLRHLQTDPTKLMDLDTFQIIADWKHFAIIELSRVKGFRSESQWIARRLGATVIEINDCIERLLQVGMLVRTNQKLVATEQFFASPTEIPSESLKRYQEQLLQKALLAIREQPVDKRDFSAVNVALSPEQLPEVKEKIKKFRRSLVSFIEEKPERDRVYCMSIQLFALDKGEL